MADSSVGAKPKYSWVAVLTTVALVGGGSIARKRIEEQRLVEAIPAHAELSRDDRLRIARAVDSTMGALVNNPDLDAQMARALGTPVRNAQERSAAARALSARGVGRLSASQLDEVFSIKLELAQRSTAVCAGMWSGRVAPGEIFAALAKLPHPRMLRWMTLSAESAQLALRAGFTVPDEDQAAVDAMLSRAAAGLDETRRTRFQRTLDQSTDAPPLDGCATWIDLLQSARAADAPLRERFYRTMARP